MILLDTNVVSEPLRPVPETRVIEWIEAQPLETLYLSAITVAELRAGVALLPTGKRRASLHHDLEKRVLPLFAGRVLPFDVACTHAYAGLIAKARAAGLAVGTADGYIAASAAANGFAVATRDTSPYEAAGLTVINPWEGKMTAPAAHDLG
jgi:predicted nucleic acid-binding protein